MPSTATPLCRALRCRRVDKHEVAVQGNACGRSLSGEDDPVPPLPFRGVEGGVRGVEELLDELWAGRVVTESTLSSRIKAARHAVGDSGRSQTCIATFNRRGYRFVAEVREQSEAVDPGPIADSQDGGILRGGALAVSEDAGGACLFPRQPGLHPDRPSLAVLPFSHSHGNDAIAWTASGSSSA